MADTSNEEKRKSVKTLYDGNTGLSIMINLYVIKYIYYHIDKARCFIDEDERGKKTKSYPIYCTDMLPVSRQRLDRINKGKRFEFSRAEANSITETFGIEMKYFRKDDPIAFEIDGIDETSWKCFYKSRYDVDYDLHIDFENEGDDIVEQLKQEVEDKLKELSMDWEQKLKCDNPLFAICYYFHYGERFDRPNTIGNLKEILSTLDYREWETESIATLNEMLKLLRGHSTYINSLVSLDKLRKEQQGKKQHPIPKIKK